MLREKEEFSRVDPDNSNKIYWLAILNWLVPICLVFIGLIITTQKFAPLMNYDPNVIGEPIFVTSKGYRFYNPLIFLIGMIKFAFNETYSFYFFQAIPPTFISLVLAILLFIITSILVNSHQKNQHIHGTARYATKKDLKKYGLLQKHGVICGELENAKINYKIDAEKAYEMISDLIRLMGATNCFFYFEDIRIYRDHKNMVNRLNNCEIANQEKSTSTGMKQVEDIEYLNFDISKPILSYSIGNTVSPCSLTIPYFIVPPDVESELELLFLSLTKYKSLFIGLIL